MTRQTAPHDDTRLVELFQALNPPLDDAGFTASVLRRVNRRLWLRRIVLGTTAAIGGALALGPILELARWLSLAFLDADLLALDPVFGLATWLSRDLVAALQWDAPAWLAQPRSQALLLATLLVVIVPGALRLLEEP